MDELEFEVLTRMGRCAGCGRMISPNNERVIRFNAFKSGAGRETICVDCLDEMKKVVTVK